MSKISKTYWIAIVLLWLMAMWYWADGEDYFMDNYRYMNSEQRQYFKWQDNESEEDFKNKYLLHFNDTAFFFPRQKVMAIKLFKNKPILGLFTAKTLRPEKILSFLQLCNDSANFSWSESTLDESEAAYFIRFYNSSNRVCGKVYLHLNGGGYISATPFCPVMKFGGLSDKGKVQINSFIQSEENWDN